MPYPVEFKQQNLTVAAHEQATREDLLQQPVVKVVEGHRNDWPQGPFVIGGNHLSTPDQPVGNLPAYAAEDGTVWMCYAFDDEELERIQEHGCIFFGLVKPTVFPVIVVLAPDDASKLMEEKPTDF